MKTITSPYEVLIRFDGNGTVTGAHVASIDRFYTDADELLFERPGLAQPLSIENFPASDIMSQVQVAALATTQRNIDKVADLERRLTEAEERGNAHAQQAAALQKAFDEAATVIENLQIELMVRSAPPAEDPPVEAGVSA